MIGLRSSYKRKLYNENSNKNPKNELDGGSTYAMGRKVFINKAYDSLKSINLPANNSSNNSRRLKRFNYESGPNPKPLNNHSSGMRIQLLKLNTIGRVSLNHKIIKTSVKLIETTTDELITIDNFSELIEVFNNNNITLDDLFGGILLNNINQILEDKNVNKEINNTLEKEIQTYIYPWFDTTTNNYSFDDILMSDYKNSQAELKQKIEYLIYPWIELDK